MSGGDPLARLRAAAEAIAGREELRAAATAYGAFAWLEIHAELDDPLAQAMHGHRMSRAAWDALHRAGVPAELVARLNVHQEAVSARVDLWQRGNLFSFGGPDARLVLAVRDAQGALVDLVALSGGCEEEWPLHEGAGEMLGEGALLAAGERAATFGRAELRLHPTPMAWLRSGCEGVCALQWNPAVLNRLRSLGETVTLRTDPGTRARLTALLQHGGLPAILETAPPRLGRAA